jgi:hypothetical protein
VCVDVQKTAGISALTSSEIAPRLFSLKRVEQCFSGFQKIYLHFHVRLLDSRLGATIFADQEAALSILVLSK